MKKLFAAVAILFIFSTFVMADIADPIRKDRKPVRRPTPEPTATPAKDPSSMGLEVRIDDGVAEPTLVISKSALARINPAGGETKTAGLTGVPFGTVAGGAFLSLAIVFGGVWAARSKTRFGKTAAILLVVASVGGATAIFADLAPPRSIPIDQDLFVPQLAGYASAKGRVKVVVDETDRGSDFYLLIPRKKS